MVGTERIELSWIAPHAPQACAYTSSATSPKYVFNSNYFFVFASFFGSFFTVFAGLTVAVVAGLTVAVLETFVTAEFVETLVIGGTVTAELALASGVTTAVFALTFASVLAGASVVESGFVAKTEILPLSAGIASIRADNIKTVAAIIVVFDKTVAVPREPKALLETLLVNNAPASDLPG